MGSEPQRLKFVKVDMTSIHVVVLSDASFANARYMRSLLGFVTLMAGEQRRANIFHYASKRCHRVSRSAMAAEVHALVHAFD